MDFDESPDDIAFRAEVRAFLSTIASEVDHPGSPLFESTSDPADFAAHVAEGKRWQGVLAEHGWACPSWPVEFGGRGLTPQQNRIFATESAKFGIGIGPLSVAVGFVAPTLMYHGTPEQQAAYLPGIRNGENIWCQLFSEPGAGSDLANLRASAVRDGDEYVVNGQKVWNSYAHVADYGILLARTDPDAQKHAGITYFVVDMRTPGIEPRPITQITGEAEFNEVFLTDVRIPAENVLGGVGNGWNVARTTLMFERGLIGGGGSTNELVERFMALVRSRGVGEDPSARQAVARAFTRHEILRYLGYRVQTMTARGEIPAAEGPIMKLLVGQHLAATAEDALALLGPAGQLVGPHAVEHGTWPHVLQSQYKVKFGGGTEQVQRNTLGERVLGLPREPRVDLDRPFREIPQ